MLFLYSWCKKKGKHFKFLSNYAFFVFLQILEFLKMSTPQEKAQCAPSGTSSPDTTPFNFLLCGCVKNTVCCTKDPDINDVNHRITEAIPTINADMLRQTWREIEYWLDILRATNGAPIEMY